MMARSGRFFGPGEVRLALLSLLTEALVQGYELMNNVVVGMAVPFAGHGELHDSSTLTSGFDPAFQLLGGGF
jgi:hypothetical protein